MSCPEPLVPPDCELRGMEFMPLDVSRLLKSQTWMSGRKDPRIAFASMNLWCASWGMSPASSLPNDDSQLEYLSMLGSEAWAEVRERVLSKWVLCSDGLLYHPIVAERALHAWGLRVKWRDKKRTQRGRPQPVPGDIPETSPLEGEVKGSEVKPKTLNPLVVSKAADELVSCPHDKIIAMYHAMLPECPRVVDWSPGRRKELAARWRWLLTDKLEKTGKPRFTDEAGGLAWFKRFFEHVLQSEFLRGWTAFDLGWLVRRDNFAKVMSGKYHGKEG